MFERFTEQARQVVVLAQDEARLLKHNYIGLEHLLLGLLRGGSGPARELLDSAGVSADEVRATIRSSVGEGKEVTFGQIPFTPRAKKALELALREALARGENYIGPEHVVLGLASAAGVPHGDDVDRVREGVARILSGPPDKFPDREFRSATPWWKRAEIDVRVFFALVATAFGIGVLVGWAIWGH